MLREHPNSHPVLLLTAGACHQCDLLFRHGPDGASSDRTSICPRCGALLYRRERGSLETTLALAGAALVLMALAHAFPVLGLDVNGQRTDATVFEAIAKLWRDGMQAVAIVVLLTTIVAPLLELAGIVWLALPLLFGRRPPAFARVFRLLQRVRPWAMPEVLVLSVLVAMVKLSHLADLLPGVGIWSFGGLIVLLAAMSTVFEPRALWRAWAEAQS